MTESDPTPAQRKAKPTVMWTVLAVAAALALALGVWLTISLTTASEAEPTPTASATTQPSAVPTQTPTASETPEPVATAIATPTDCRAIYSQAFLDEYASVELNDPSLDGVEISRHPAVETIRESLPGIECRWGVPTEGGMSTAVNEVTADEQLELIAAAEDSGFTCGDATDGIVVCQISESFSDEAELDPKTWTIAEELYFRDGLVISTWRAGTVGTMADSTQPVYDTLWP